jgi:hypothetical protein
MSYEDYARQGPIMMPPSGVLTYDHEGEKVEGLTRDDLINKLTELRAANHKRIGDPARDVDRVLSKNPHYTSAIPVKTLERPRPRLELIDRVNSWLANRREKLKTLSFVPVTEANRRASICAMCKYQKAWTGCQSCGGEAVRNVEREVIILSQNKRTPFHNRLMACSITGQENRLAVFLDSSLLQHRVNYMDRLPNWCWLKDLE